MKFRQLVKQSPAGPHLKRVYRWYSLRPTVLTLDGFRVSIPRRDVPRYRAGFEPLTTDWIKGIVHPGMVVVDVGAAIGFFSLGLWRLVGPKGRVIAIEPAPTNVELIEHNARRNGASIQVISAAACDEDGVRAFTLTDSSDSHAFFRHPLIAPASRIDVKVVRLDSVVETADFVKIDVEGAEIDVLSGASRLLAQRPPLVVEWVPSCQAAAGRSAEQLPEWLVRAGYRFEVFDELNHLNTSVEAVLQTLERGELPLDWYANLCCLPD